MLRKELKIQKKAENFLSMIFYMLEFKKKKTRKQ